MGRSRQVYLALSLACSALLGWSGCLLFTDPINRAPEVKDVRALDPILRFEDVRFTATIHDDKDSTGALVVEWAVFAPDGSQSCQSLTQADWASAARELRASDEPYTYTVETLDVACVCVRATDHNGASSFACSRVQPGNLRPVASIVDVSGAVTGKKRRLCSAIHLAAQLPTQFPADELDFRWGLESPAADRSAQLAPCSDVKDESQSSQHRCFVTAVPGIYTVKLSIVDTPKGYAAMATTSEQASFTLPVSDDAPPCLRQTDPGIHADKIVLSSDPSASRTFEVVSVDDDCEPYPASAGKTQAQFVWSVWDATRGWTYQTNTTASFTVSQATVPNALRGDAIQVRVETRDAAVQRGYLAGRKACASDEVAVCSENNDNDDECVRWTTWTVYFVP